MRRTRPLILLLIVFILGGVGLTYYRQKEDQARNAPSKPPTLPESVSAQADDWTHSETRDGVPIYHVSAKTFQQSAEGDIQLGDVVLRLFSKDGKTFDEVKSAKADFDVGNGILFSEGAVQITMGVGADLSPEQLENGRLVVIKTSGVHFESKSGKAWTEKPASFEFNRGEGRSEGAEYNPNTRELHMRKNAYLKWVDSAKPMEVQAGSIVYKEGESKVWLLDWSKFKRDTLTMDAGPSIVTLEKGVIRHVEAASARGDDVRSNRKVHYAADHLDMQFGEKGAIEDIIGNGNARLISTAATAETIVNSDRLDLDFEAGAEDSVLTKVTGVGKSVIESKPLPRPNTPTPDTRFLRSEIIAMYMRAGGEEIERLQAEAPGSIDFIPNRLGQKKRHMEGEGITLKYGADNQVEAFSAVSVTTRTESEPVKGKSQPPAITSSKGMAAKFEPKTASLVELEQWGDFKYQEGERQAKSDRAVLEQTKDQITLTGSARVWDPTGSTAANKIVMNQTSGDVQAEGDVTSTRLPEKSQKGKDQATPGGAMLSSDEPLQAKAERMTSIEDNLKIQYEGKALMWQGSNRLQADWIHIDRKASRLEAQGNVTSQLLDKAETKKQKKGSVFTLVKAPQMIYLDSERLAHYQGGVTLTRGSMVVNSRELRAFLKEEEQGGSSLDRALADGSVRIVDSRPQRTRTGTSEHAEYYVVDEKVLLQGGQPQLVDSVKGTTKGRQITYFSQSDKLIVEGEQGKPVESRILRK